jgi:hypothetical protein
MTSRIQFLHFVRALCAFCFALTLACAFILPAQAKSSLNSFPDLNTFIESVRDGDANVLRGVYVQDVMAFSVMQQPDGSPGFVSQNADQLTQFSMATQAGNVGLLAHDYLAGTSFSDLKIGDVVLLVFGDGHTENYLVTNILQYQALDPNSPYSDFKDLETQAVLNAGELFNQVYGGERHVTFQTCIFANGDLSWGRLFVVAEPMTGGLISATGTITGIWRN